MSTLLFDVRDAPRSMNRVAERLGLPPETGGPRIFTTRGRRS